MTDRADIWIEYMDGPNVRMGCAIYSWQNSTRINERAAALGKKYSQGWYCAYCGNLMPEWKRIDAKYCKEGCRKMAARIRREHR
ncbi:MAG: hypothetical protein AB3N15_10535 [Paracoccaceae bacterium]